VASQLHHYDFGASSNMTGFESFPISSGTYQIMTSSPSNLCKFSV